jgi:hypothetical protein
LDSLLDELDAAAPKRQRPSVSCWRGNSPIA